MIDDRSEKNIQTLAPSVQPLFREFLIKLKEYFEPLGINAVIICGTRTLAEQNALYAKGKTVTKARAGYSYHNLGMAIDIGLFRDGKYLQEPELYNQIGIIVREFSELEWGGEWKGFKDTPHVQYRLSSYLKKHRNRTVKKEVTIA